MPDPLHQTLSATQVPALWGHGYSTEFLLYHHFANGVEIPEADEDNERIEWGKMIEPVILRAAAQRLRLDVYPNLAYHRHPEERIGCTRDADVIDPALGYGVVEAKNVDWLVHRREWQDEAAPPHIEIQVQTQLMIPHPEHGYPKWAVIAVLVGGNELHLIRRDHDTFAQSDISREVARFFADVDAKREPKPMGTDREFEMLKAMYKPLAEDSEIVINDEDLELDAMDLDRLAAERNAADKLHKAVTARLKAAAQGHSRIILPHSRVYIRRAEIAATATRKAYTRETIKFKENT